MQHFSYEVRNYDETLMYLEARRDEYGQEYLVSAEVVPSTERLLPLPILRALRQTSRQAGIAHSPEDPNTPSLTNAAWSWLRSRVIPKNRAFVSSLLAQAGLVPGDTLGIINLCRGLSVNDTYWVVPEGSTDRYKDFSLFDNELDEVLALVAYTGYTSSQHRRLGLSSEWTTDGQAAKAWRKIDGQLLLYKAGTEGYANAGTEPYSELFCSQVAHSAGIGHVPYWLDRWQGKLASVCPLMHEPDVAFVPWYSATGSTTIKESLWAAREIGPSALASLRTMYVFDALIHNTDRHTNNFGVLRDCRTGTLLGTAPLFDHNLALFAGDMASDYAGWSERGRRDRPAGTRMTFDGVARLVMSEEAHRMLGRITGLSLLDDERYPIGADRVRALNAYLRTRAAQLLELEPHSDDDLFAELERLA